jgi:zinc/manganese transport system substrate-binding protein/manganese/iron transport system substrate-binding protein
VIRRLAALLVPLAVGLLGACSSGSSSSASTPGTTGGDRLLVVTTTTQLTDFVRNLGGDIVDVHPLLKPNVDPHDFEPSAADLVALHDADVIVENGVDLEHWFASTVASAEPTGAIVDASTGVTVRDDDPHIWQDPTNVTIMATNIADELAAADPENAATYRANLADYAAQLAALDREIGAQIDTLANKKLVTNHDAFAYYVARYGLDFVGSVIPSFDTQAELSPSDVHDLVARIRAEGVKAIFTEESLPPKTAEAIAAEAGVEVVGGDAGLYGDSLGPAGSDGDTYLKMMRHNTKAIVDNLR